MELSLVTLSSVYMRPHGAHNYKTDLVDLGAAARTKPTILTRGH